MIPTIDSLRSSRELIAAAATQFGVERVRVFGSVARGTSKEGSDVDLLVAMKPGRTLLDVVGFEQALEDNLGISFDVVEEGGVHPMLEQDILSEARAL